MRTSKFREVMGVKEVAEFLGISCVSIYRLLRKKEIPAKKIGGLWRFSREEIDRWLIERELENRRFSNCSCI